MNDGRLELTTKTAFNCWLERPVRMVFGIWRGNPRFDQPELRTCVYQPRPPLLPRRTTLKGRTTCRIPA